MCVDCVLEHQLVVRWWKDALNTLILRIKTQEAASPTRNHGTAGLLSTRPWQSVERVCFGG